MLTPLPIRTLCQLPSVHRPLSFSFKTLSCVYTKCWALEQLWWQRETKGPQEHNLMGNSYYKQIKNFKGDIRGSKSIGRWKLDRRAAFFPCVNIPILLLSYSDMQGTNVCWWLIPGFSISWVLHNSYSGTITRPLTWNFSASLISLACMFNKHSYLSFSTQ